MSLQSIPRVNRKAFSLVELLVVIAIIAVLAAVALPTIAGIVSASNAARSQRNAQNLASLFNSASASMVPSAQIYTNKLDAANAIRAGLEVATPSSSNATVFRLDGLNDADCDAALTYLDFSISTKTLVYLGSR